MPSDSNTSKLLLLTRTTQHVDVIIAGIAYLHAHCILYDGTLATYLPPLSFAKLIGFWIRNLEEVEAGRRHIVVQLMAVSSRTANTEGAVFAADESGQKTVPAPTLEIDGLDYEVAGVVSLYMPETETGPFRGLIEKLFASPNHRRKGVARAVMERLEQAAWKDGRWNLMLDTIVGTDAEEVYPRLGYVKVGAVSDYGIHPKTRELVNEVWFWKDLRKTMKS